MRASTETFALPIDRVQRTATMPQSISAFPPESAVRSEAIEAHLAHPKYRADIDGLRAVAVLAVLGFHAFPYWFSGGFVGVDIFFVISGFLISTIIFQNLGVGGFSYVEFYARRIKRIFPALIIVLSFVLIAGWFVSLPVEYRQLGKHVSAGSSFISNFVLRSESGYFDSSADTKPLLHLWSLAIEEQFYILWPLLLVVWTRKVRFLWIIPVIAVGSFVFNMTVIDADPVRAFYSPLSRFWELMIGGMLAQLLLFRPLMIGRYRNVQSFIGFTLIVCSVFLLNRNASYPGWRALLPTVGTFLVISAGSRAFLNRHLLGNRVAVWVGSISYPLYLWHWPLLSFAFVEHAATPSRSIRIGILSLSFVLAWLTYRFVETPVRTSRNIQSVPIFLLLAIGMIGVFGCATFLQNGFDFRFGDKGAYLTYFDNTTPDLKYSTRINAYSQFREDCDFYDLEQWRSGTPTRVPRDSIGPTCYTRAAKSSKAVLVWGDSHAAHLHPGLKAALPTDVAILQVASSACSAELVELETRADSYCAKSNQFALSIIRKEKPEVVLIAQRVGHDLRRFRRIANELKQAGVRAVMVLGPIPQWKPDLNETVARHYWNATPIRLNSYLDPDVLALDRKLKMNLRQAEPFTYVDLVDFFCNDHGCATYLDGDRRDGLITYDYGHLTLRASAYLGRSLLAPMVMRLMTPSNEFGEKSGKQQATGTDFHEARHSALGTKPS